MKLNVAVQYIHDIYTIYTPGRTYTAPKKCLMRCVYVLCVCVCVYVCVCVCVSFEFSRRKLCTTFFCCAATFNLNFFIKIFIFIKACYTS